MPSAYISANDLPLITVCGYDFRKEVAVMHNVVVDLNLLSWMKIEPPSNTGYMFWDDPNISKILNDPKVLSCGHSGATEAYCLRYVQQIARLGLEKFCDSMKPKNQEVKTD